MNTSDPVLCSENSKTPALRVQRRAICSLEDPQASQKLIDFLDQKEMRISLEDACVFFGFRAEENFGKQQQVRTLLHRLCTDKTLMRVYDNLYCRPDQAVEEVYLGELAFLKKEEERTSLKATEITARLDAQVQRLTEALKKKKAAPQGIPRAVIIALVVALLDCSPGRAKYLFKMMCDRDGVIKVIPGRKGMYKLIRKPRKLRSAVPVRRLRKPADRSLA